MPYPVWPVLQMQQASAILSSIERKSRTAVSCLGIREVERISPNGMGDCSGNDAKDSKEPDTAFVFMHTVVQSWIIRTRLGQSLDDATRGTLESNTHLGEPQRAGR